MEEKVRKLLEKHNKDKDLTKEKIKPGWDWSKANLRGFNLKKLELSTPEYPADFKNADLSGAHLEGTRLLFAYLKEAKLEDAYLQGADLLNANLEEANLNHANLEKARLIKAHMEGASLYYVNLKEADLWDTHLEGSILVSANLEGANLKKTHLEGVDLQDADLEGARLERAHLEGAVLISANLKDTDLKGAVFRYADLYMSNLDGSNIEYAFLSEEDIHESGWKELREIIKKLEKENINSTAIDKIKRHLDSTIDVVYQYGKASDVYRTIKNTYHQNGSYNKESDYHFKEQRALSKYFKANKQYGKWLLNTVFRWLCGYGEKPLRIIVCFVGLILFFTLFFGITGGLMATSETAVLRPLDYTYFSLITAATLSFGDIVPNPAVGLMDISWFRFAAMIEAFLGTFIMALFVVVTAKRVMR